MAKRKNIPKPISGLKEMKRDLELALSKSHEELGYVNSINKLLKYESEQTTKLDRFISADRFKVLDEIVEIFNKIDSNVVEVFEHEGLKNLEKSLEKN